MARCAPPGHEGLTVLRGKPQTLAEGTANPLRFHAREADLQTGLYYVRARWYDPELARFLSEDPIGLEGGINPYAYVGNSPTNGRDPSGLQPPEYPGTIALDELVVRAKRTPYVWMPTSRGYGPSSFGPGTDGGWAGSGAGGTWNGGDSEDSSLSQFFSVGFKVCGSPGVDPGDCVVAATVPGWIGGPGGAGLRVVRNISQRNAYLRSILDRTPAWMRGFIVKGRVPPGHVVDHIKPLSVGGLDAPSNMRLLTIKDHLRHHRYYHPWRR